MGRPFDRSNVQAIILKPYAYPISRHLIFSIGNKKGARAFVREWVDSVAHGGRDLSATPEPLINIAISWTGLVKIGAFDDIGGVDQAAAAFPWDFRDDPHQESLGAFGAGAPANWWGQQFKSADIDLICHLYCMTEAGLESTTTWLRESAARTGLRELFASSGGEAITGRAYDGRKLHFGYEDGISHPPINWDDVPDRPDLLPRGQFLLGDWLENAQSFPKDDPWKALTTDGSYVGYFWLHQDVAAFNKFLREQAPVAAPHLPQGDAEEWLAAKLMGRWRDGTPLSLSPDGMNPALATANDFGYADDPSGLKCPFAAHIRIVNGRDQPLNFVNKSMFPAGFPRVLRRGSPYGPPLTGETDDGCDRGIVGMFLCANINQQIYSLTRWIGKTDFSDVYRDQHGQDPLVGNRSIPSASTTFSIPTDKGTIAVKGLIDFVRLQGVAFLLMPSLQTLRHLSI
jgi:deferrochelatase/peroxidase EfeB